MKIIFSEGPAQYEDYTFLYAIYAVPEAQELALAYSQGFLPYTGNLQLRPPHFYLCRSLRVDLEKFELGSENRRILNKLDANKIQHNILRIEHFQSDPSALAFCMRYIESRLPSGALRQERLTYILELLPALNVHQIKYEEVLLGYVLMVETYRMCHYWFAFYNLELDLPVPLGKFLMTYMIEWGRKKENTHIYLGTCYQTKSLYKARDFKGIEYFDGSKWKSDLNHLKALCKRDGQSTALTDHLKLNNFNY